MKINNMTSLCILLILNSMNCSIEDYYPDQLNQGLDNIHQERLHSLELQIESLRDFQPHIVILKDIINQHRDCKIVRDRSLLEQQHRLVNRQEKQNQLNRYYCRIRELQQSIKIKEQDMWQQSLNGKRVRNIALHREAINIFHHEERQTESIFYQLTKRDQLLKQVAKLQVLLNKQEPPKDHQNYYMEGIDTTLLKIIMDEEQIECELKELEESLKDELRQEGNKQIELIHKYQELSSQKMNKNVGQLQETNNRETSSKTISTQGQQSQF